MAGAKRKHPPIPVIVIVLLLVIGGGTWWWWSTTQHSSATEQWQATGSIEATEYQVAPAMNGRITSVEVAEGDQVTEGLVLVRLDRDALTLQLEQARQGVTAAKAAVTNAKRDDDATKADVTAAKARRKQATAAVKLAKVQLGYTVVTAPRGGTVVSVTANEGENAAAGRTLITLVDPTDLFVRVFVTETEIGQVRIGGEATLTVDASAETFTGTVSFIASEAEFTPNSVQTREQRAKLVYEVRVQVSDPSATLKAGRPVDVSFS